jgi:outer membrane protein TolC
VNQAERAYRIAEIRWREGLSTQLELSDSRILLQQAQANRAQSARDLLVARLRLALLPLLPLDTSADPAAVPQSADTAPRQQVGGQRSVVATQQNGGSRLGARFCSCR